ncbi:RHS repeat domain-containing protein, partial [Pseudoalteromonas sp. B530]|uniref:RHS repeat domain-containing protein n=1 Tax=Pseudoalteromonas sp. B530 TaxID=2994390 RepID=UPI00224B603D
MGAFTSERQVSSFPGISNFRLPSIAGLVESDFKAVVVTNPDNSQHRYIHSRKYNWLENAMLSKEIIKDGETLKFEQYTYHQSNRRGIDKNFLSNTELNEYARLTKEVQISLFGADGNPHLYSSEVQEFNEYDQPNLIIYKTTQSDVEQKKYVKNSYTHDTENKVFNLPLTTEFSSDGKSYSQVSRKTYKSQRVNAATVKVADKLYVNGQEVRTETNYDDNGNVTAIKFNQKLRGTQGNRYIEYSDFKFGKAQVITTPDRLTDKKLTLKLTFDDNGWLTSATDFNGTPTNYSYDEIGNLETINLENDSNTNWLDSKFVWNNTNNTRTIKRCTLNQYSKCSEAAPLVETVETYDSLLRLTQTKTIDNTINADATTSVRYQNFEYDYQNRQTLASFVSTDSADSTDSAELKGTRTTYDALGRTKTVSVSG